ncbi:MAG TPA: prepilin-type N-terminal cleavage/methylation domain-containing protein [Pseudomonadales bacterium]|nr:prepilin-type N-terminal cleavage/methylation domain-containing protein [Pseudomonadales bacterium]
MVVRHSALCIQRRKFGFTLLELLVVIAMIAILAALLLPVLARSIDQAHKTEEISAGRQLMLGVQMYSQDFNDAVFIGYASAQNVGPPVLDNFKLPVQAPANYRYPWRLVPYMSGSMALIYSGVNRVFYQQMQSSDAPDATDRFNYDYGTSLCPSLGINSCFIGGDADYATAAQANAQFGPQTVLSKMNGAIHPSDLMVFMSARGSPSGSSFAAGTSFSQVSVEQGWFRVLPPWFQTRQWASDYSQAATPDEWGQVAPRFNNHAIAAMLDGHTEEFNLQQMQDMRHWCNRATSGNWTLGQQ